MSRGACGGMEPHVVSCDEVVEEPHAGAGKESDQSEVDDDRVGAVFGDLGAEQADGAGVDRAARRDHGGVMAGDNGTEWLGARFAVWCGPGGADYGGMRELASHGRGGAVIALVEFQVGAGADEGETAAAGHAVGGAPAAVVGG